MRSITVSVNQRKRAVKKMAEYVPLGAMAYAWPTTLKPPRYDFARRHPNTNYCTQGEIVKWRIVCSVLIELLKLFEWNINEVALYLGITQKQVCYWLYKGGAIGLVPKSKAFMPVLKDKRSKAASYFLKKNPEAFVTMFEKATNGVKSAQSIDLNAAVEAKDVPAFVD